MEIAILNNMKNAAVTDAPVCETSAYGEFASCRGNFRILDLATMSARAASHEARKEHCVEETPVALAARLLQQQHARAEDAEWWRLRCVVVHDETPTAVGGSRMIPRKAA